MTVLHSKMRPVEQFDANNRAHRRLYAQFIRTGRWGHSPVRFVANEPTSADVNTMARQLIEFYTKQEFENTAC